MQIRGGPVPLPFFPLPSFLQASWPLLLSSLGFEHALKLGSEYWYQRRLRLRRVCVFTWGSVQVSVINSNFDIQSCLDGDISYVPILGVLLPPRF